MIFTAKSALILGGGIIGLTCALRLLERGLSVTVLDPQKDRVSASLGNAGHLAVEQAAPLSSPQSLASAPRRLFAFGGPLDFPFSAAATWAPFALRYVAASKPQQFNAGKAALSPWLAEAVPAWRRLGAAINAQDLIIEQGHFVVWESAKSAAKGAAAWAAMNTKEAAFRSAADAELAEITKRVRAPVASAVRFERSGQIFDLDALQSRLIGIIKNAGGEFVDAKAKRISIHNGRATAIVADNVYTADIVLVAAGADSGPLMKDAGHPAPLIAERGYHIEGVVEGWPPFPPVAFEDRSLIISRFANSLRLASFVEFASVETPPDPRKWRRLRRHADDLGIHFAGPVREWMGARPTLPDYLPAIGKSNRASNLFYAFGHQHLGLTLAAVTGEAIADLICKERPALDIEPFDLARFA